MNTAAQAAALAPRTVTLPRLVPHGVFFRCADGTPYTVKEHSDFQLLRLLLAGKDLSPILVQRRELGFNQVRVFGTVFWGADGELDPRHYGPVYYDALGLLADIAASYGLRLNFVAFTGAQRFTPGEQQNHMARCGDALRGGIHLLSQVNEADQYDNRLTDPNAYQPPADLLFSRGSNGAGNEDPPFKAGDIWTEYHTNDTSEWQRRAGHNAMEIGERLGTVSYATENTRADKEIAAWGMVRACEHAFDAAAASALLTAGSTCHTTAGKFSQILDGPELRWAEAWLSGIASVPLRYQDGAYSRSLDPAFLRVYHRTLGTDTFTVPVRF